MEIGQVCIKIAGRDAGGEAVIIDILNDRIVLIDGNVRRRKCNMMHLEPTSRKIEIAKGASHEEVAATFKQLGWKTWETKKKSPGQKPKTKPRQAEPKAEKPEAKPVKEAKIVTPKKKAPAKKKAEPKAKE